MLTTIQNRAQKYEIKGVRRRGRKKMSKGNRRQASMEPVAHVFWVAE